MLGLPPTVEPWFCPQPVDRRLGFDGPFTLVRSRLNADPLSGHLFIFHNRTADRLKVLYWADTAWACGANASKPDATTFPTPLPGPTPSS